jgi:hypothetical protein
MAAWLEYISDREQAQYEISVDDYFPDASFARWKETHTAGHVVSEGHCDCMIIGSDSLAYINVPGIDMSPGPVLYFHGNSLWISEGVIGNIVDFSIDRASRTVLVRSSADHTFKVAFL